MATTMKDIARICGLSAGSVSQVIRNPENPRFTPATRKLILDTAKALDYRQNPLSCALRTNRTNLIGLVLPWNEPEVMDNLESLVNANGYKLLLQFTASPREGMELEALRSLLDWNVDGILWEPSGCSDPRILLLLKQLKQERRPMVMLERGVEGIELPLVWTDYGPALRACVSHLCEQGYHRVVFVAYSGDSELKNQQRENLENACAEHHLAFSLLEVFHDIEHERQTIEELVPVSPEADTVYVCQSWIAFNLLEVLESRGLSAPRDYGLVLLQDMLLGSHFRLSSFCRPQLTSIWVNSAALARHAIRLLFDTIGDYKCSEGQSIREPAVFSVRASTQRH